MTQEAPSSGGAPRRPARGRRRVLPALGVLLALALAAELGARHGLGLADPPLFVADPQIEYMLAPMQDCRYLGNRFITNASSMRSAPLPAAKSDPREVRVLFVGDSVINGGTFTDQAELMTEVIRTRLGEALGRPVAVGNASCNSWGPPNQAAYLRRYGLFDADLVVLVMNSTDAADVPDGVRRVGVDPGYPARKPSSAAVAGAARALARIVPRLMGQRDPEDRPALTDQMYAEALGAVREMAEMARAQGAGFAVGTLLEPREIRSQPDEGHGRIVATLAQIGTPHIDLTPVFREAIGAGRRTHRDARHPNALGQRLMTDAMVEAIVPMLRARLEAPAAPDQPGAG